MNLAPLLTDVGLCLLIFFEVLNSDTGTLVPCGFRDWHSLSQPLRSHVKIILPRRVSKKKKIIICKSNCEV
jgi:hypothetical protein